MYVIIPTSDIETQLCPLSEPISRSLMTINKKPCLQYIMDELYSWQYLIDEVILVKKDVSDLKEFISYNVVDEFFKTKIRFVETTKCKCSNKQEFSIVDDFYSAMEFLVDEEHAEGSDILVWSGDEFIRDSGKLADITNGNFVCTYKGKDVNVWHFNDFVACVNANVKAKENDGYQTMKDFVTYYKQFSFEEVEILELSEWCDYHKWATPMQRTLLEVLLQQESGKDDCIKSVDLVKQQMTLTNKYADMDYDYETYQKSHQVQYNLFTLAQVLEEATDEQNVFLPNFIDRGINVAGEFTNEVTLEYVKGDTLSDWLFQNLPQETWDNMIRKVCLVMTETFHNICFEEGWDKYDSYLQARQIVAYRENLISRFNDALEMINSKYTCCCCYNQSDIALGNNDYAEWKMLIDEFAENMGCYIDKDSVISNMKNDKLVLGGCDFDNIIFDTYNNRLVFLNPLYRKYEIVDMYEDYAVLYLSAMVGVDAFENNRLYTCYNCNKECVKIPTAYRQQMEKAIRALDSFFKKDAFFIKIYGLLLCLEYVANYDGEPEIQAQILEHINGMKKLFLN